MTTTEPAATTEAVLNHHLSAFDDRDMSEILSDYTDESVIVTNLGTFGDLLSSRTSFRTFSTSSLRRARRWI